MCNPNNKHSMHNPPNHRDGFVRYDVHRNDKRDLEGRLRESRRELAMERGSRKRLEMDIRDMVSWREHSHAVDKLERDAKRLREELESERASKKRYVRESVLMKSTMEKHKASVEIFWRNKVKEEEAALVREEEEGERMRAEARRIEHQEMNPRWKIEESWRIWRKRHPL